MSQTNNLTARQLVTLELHTMQISLAMTMKIIAQLLEQETTRPPTPHPRDCAKCTTHALKLQTRHTQAATFLQYLGDQIANHRMTDR